MSVTTTETLDAAKISSSCARVPGTVPRTSWIDTPKVSSSFIAALRAAEQLQTVTHTAASAFEVLAAQLERSVEDLWVSPITVELSDDMWPSHDHEPRHPRRCDHELTARQYRAACRHWRREHRAWRRRDHKPVHMVAIRAWGRALTRDGTVQKFGCMQIVPRRIAVEEPALVELVVKDMTHKMRAGLVRHWEEA